MRMFRTISRIGMLYGGYKAFRAWQRNRALKARTV